MKVHRLIAAVFLLVALTAAGQTIGGLQARDKMLEGVRNFEAGRLDSALPLFQEALRLDPQLINAQVYLATSYARLFVPGATSEENRSLAAKAIAEFESVLNKQPDNSLALAGLAFTLQNTGDYRGAREYLLRNAELHPSDAQVAYQVAVIDWITVRDKQSPPSTSESASLIEEGLRYIDRALDINPDYDEAMSYKNLLLREKARLTLDPFENQRLIAQADLWFEKALESRKRNQGRSPSTFGTPPPPPPPPPPPRPSPPLTLPPGTIRLGGQEMESNLVYHTDPVYPELAKQVRLQGTVIMEALINRDGVVESVRVLSGHPLLSQAALDALKQWRYKPVLVNGQPGDVVTTVTVGFKLP